MLHIAQGRELQAADMRQEVLQGKALVCLGLIQRRRIGPAEIILCGGDYSILPNQPRIQAGLVAGVGRCYRPSIPSVIAVLDN
jgi:hypothetical protein